MYEPAATPAANLKFIAGAKIVYRPPSPLERAEVGRKGHASASFLAKPRSGPAALRRRSCALRRRKFSRKAAAKRLSRLPSFSGFVPLSWALLMPSPIRWRCNDSRTIQLASRVGT